MQMSLMGVPCGFPYKGPPDDALIMDELGG